MKYQDQIKNMLMAVVLLVTTVSSGDEAGNSAVKEFLEVSGAKKQYDQMIIVMTENMKDGFYQGFNTIAEEKELEEDLRAKKTAIFSNKFNQFVEDFKIYMHEEISWDVLVNEVYSPAYLKYLTVDEIKEITSFYKSKTGSKYADISPSLIQESPSKFNQIYSAELNDFAIQAAKKRMNEAIDEFKAVCRKKC